MVIRIPSGVFPDKASGSSDWYLEDFPLGVVEEQSLSALPRKGRIRVRFRNAYWKARTIESSSRKEALVPGQQVRVVGRQNTELVVAPIEEGQYYLYQPGYSPKQQSIADVSIRASFPSDHAALDAADARISETQSTIQNLRKETEKELANLSEVIDLL